MGTGDDPRGRVLQIARTFGVQDQDHRHPYSPGTPPTAPVIQMSPIEPWKRS